MDTTTKKTCKMCCQEIDAKAKKCPFCHHWQSRAVGWCYHPLVTILPIGVMFVTAGAMIQSTFNSGEPFESHRDELVIKESAMKFGTQSNCCNGATVDVLGTLKNTSRFSWKDINVEARFYGEHGKLMDGGQKLQYSLEVPAGSEAVFKVSLRRDFPQEAYKTHTIKILSAKDNRSWP
jgi:hypothetical protein